MNVRHIRSATDVDVERAVVMARAVLRLDDRLHQAEQDLAKRDATIATMRSGAETTGRERQRMLDQVHAVEDLHAEADKVICGDGCCHEGLGYCGYDREPYPCKTIQALRRHDPDYATEATP